MLQDLKFSLRNLRRNPGFAAVAVLTLALGIGANTAIFSVVDSVLLKPLPYRDSSRLVYMQEQTKSGRPMSVSWMNFLDWKKLNRSFESMSVIRFNSWAFAIPGSDPEMIDGDLFNASLLPMLGAQPALGRLFTDQDDRAGVPKVAILSYASWQRRFGGADVLGRIVYLDDAPFTIVGVLAKDFHFVGRTGEIYVPAGVSAADRDWADRGNHPGLRVYARLKPDVTISQARADLSSIAAGLEREFPVSNAGNGITITPLYEVLVQDARPTLQMLLAAVGFVLLTACVNVANLLLARGSARTRELSVRVAMGASRGRVMRQLMVESAVLSLAGGVFGCLFAAWALTAMLKLAPAGVPRLDQAALDGTVLLFTMGVSLITGILFGLAPALKLSRPDLVGELKTGGRGQTTGRATNRLRSVLLVAEIALALIMVSGAGLMIRSIAKLGQVHPGVDVENVLTFHIALPAGRYEKPPQHMEFFRQALDRIRAVPGVVSAAAVNCLPLDGGCWGSFYWVDGRPAPPTSARPSADFNSVSPGYFETLHIPVIAGRVFATSDQVNAPLVAVIGESTTKHMFPGEDPVGKVIHQGYAESPNVGRQIVGVVGDVQRYGLDHKQNDEIYWPITQIGGRDLSIVVRTTGDPMALRTAVEDAIHNVDRNQPLAKMRPMTELLASTLAQRKFNTILLGVFAALALGLAGVGIYGVTAYSVTLRTQEVGIRMALGARSTDVLTLVLKQGLRLAATGVAVGLAASSALTWLIATLLYGVAPRDPLTLSLASATLVGVALIACYLPARRASKLDPMVALRCE